MILRRAALVLVLTGFGAAVAPATPAGAVPREPSIGELEQRIDRAGHRLEIVVEAYNESREDLRDTVDRTRALDGRLGPMTEEMRARQRQIGGLVAETYRQTRSGPTIALLGSRTPHQFVDRLLVLNRLATDQREAVGDLQAARNRVDAARHALDALAALQRHLKTQLNTKKATVEGVIEALRGLRDIAYGSGSAATGDTGTGDTGADTADRPAPPYVPGPAGAAVAFAFRQLGKPYRWGADGPNSYDCSGLTSSAWSRGGVHLPHNARRQFGTVARIGRDDLRPGDLVFFYGGISHVGMYVGDGRMIHAPVFGENVRMDRFDFQPIHGFGRPT